MEKTLKQVLVITLLVLLAAISFVLIADKATSLEANQATITSIDGKAETVLKLTAASTLASAGISAIPGDTATPIAEKLADFTEYFLLILCVLYAEKYLLTIIGAGAFKILIPLACVLLIVSLFWKPKVMKRLALKAVVFGLALFIMIPLSIRVSDMVYNTYESSIDGTITAAEEFTETTSELAEAKDDEGLVASIMNKLSETAASLSEKAAKTLNRFVESLAVMIVTSCIIPLLVLIFFIWLLKFLTGRDLNIPLPKRAAREGNAEDTENTPRIEP